MRLSRLRFALVIVVLLLSLTQAEAHRDGCHRQHSCLSDSGTYVCGDLGNCAQCPDNDYCFCGLARQVTALPSVCTRTPSPTIVFHKHFTGKVVGLSDGDTFAVLHNGEAIKVRLYGIDTPEKAQAFGMRARQYASALVFQQVVTVLIKGTDRYGRLVGEVVLADGRSVNQELVSAGMAWWYRQYAPNDTTLAQLEAEAKAVPRGLWVDPTPIPPWTWRKR